MIVIGIVGGVASGKSFVASVLQQLGAERLDADRIGHEVLQEADVKQALVRRWGSQILTPDGDVDRTAVGQIVFSPPPEGPCELAYLEQWSHPRIARRLQQRIQELAQAAETEAVVLDAAVMVKAGWDRICNKIVFVDTPWEIRHRRAQERGWSDQQLATRESMQNSLERKRSRADVVIDNSGSREDTIVQIKQFWRSLKGDQPRQKQAM